MRPTVNKLFWAIFLFVSVFIIYNFQNNIEANNKYNPESNFTNLIQSSEEIPDEIESFCNGLEYDKYTNLNIEDIKNLDVKFYNREQWFQNLFYLSFEKSRSINPSYKDLFYGTIVISFHDNLSCEFEAQIRISGDWNDHIDKINLISSLDIKLLNGNILGITKFKLFIPSTRNGDNEIVVTSMLEELGFLSPRTFYVNVGMNNHSNVYISNKYIFQEKLSKEMIEHNGFREAPILETNENFFWEEVISNKFNLETGNPLFIAKSLNNYWARKGDVNRSITIEGIQMFNKSIFNSYNPFAQVNYSYLGENQDLFYMFDAANIALLSEHGLSTHQRRFYFNKIENQFYPVYYDGNSNFIELGHIRWKNDYVDKNNLYKGAGKLLKIVDINKDSFYKKINNRGLNFDKAIADGLVDKFIHNLKIISEQPIQKEIPHKNFFENRDITNFPDMFKFIFYDSDSNIFEICDPTLKDCSISNENLFLMSEYSNKVATDDAFGYVAGVSKSSFLNGNYANKNFHEKLGNVKLKVFGNPDYKIDFDTKEIEILFNKIDQKIIILGPGTFSGWTIKASSNIKNDNNNSRLDKNLLTGCLTIYNVNLSNVNFNLKDLHCEDSLNIINSYGKINKVEIFNSHSDALDIDFSELEIKNLLIDSAQNDCLDLSGGQYFIGFFEGKNCKDKAISVGEGTDVSMGLVNISSAYIGIAVKDSSKAKIEKFSGLQINLCLAAYRKKQEFGPSSLQISNLNCEGNTSDFAQSGSVIKIGN